MKFKVSPDKSTAKAIASMEKPTEPNPADYISGARDASGEIYEQFDKEIFDGDYKRWEWENKQYENHVASRPEITLSPSLSALVEGGQVIESGVDFVEQYQMKWKDADNWIDVSIDAYNAPSCVDRRILAIPLTATQDGVCGWCGTFKENKLGLCPKCGRFPALPATESAYIPIENAEEILGKASIVGPAATDRGGEEGFQPAVRKWLLECFGEEISNDVTERNHRFFEEATELVQATGATKSECMQLVDYVFSRDIGEINQEVGGVLVTLSALCSAMGLNMEKAGNTELARIWTKVESIRAKQAAKPKHSPLPVTPTPSSPSEDAGERAKEQEQYTALKPIVDRINYFASRHHKYEANELHGALNVIMRLVPPSSLALTASQGDKGVEFLKWVRKDLDVHIYWDKRERPCEYKGKYYSESELYEVFINLNK